MKVKEKYKISKENYGESYEKLSHKLLFRQGGFKSVWLVSFNEIRISDKIGNILLTIPSHGSIQLSSTVKKVGDLKTIYELAKKSVAEVYTR